MADEGRQAKLTPRMRAQYAVESAAFFGFMALFRALPVDTASALGGFIGRHVLARTPLTRRGRRNLEAILPEQSARENAAILSGMWDNLGRTIAEYAHLDAFRYDEGRGRIAIDGLEHVEAAKASGKGILFISGHFANWEIMPIAAADYGLEGGTVYRPINNPAVDVWMVKQRTENGPKEVISKGPAGLKRIFSLLRKSKAILMLVDQKFNEGIPANFFGRMAMTTPAPAVLALRQGAVLLPATNERLGGARFRMTVFPPLTMPNTGDNERDVIELTQTINDWLEREIRKRPGQWLWLHRRWPKASDSVRSRRGKSAQDLGGVGDGVARDGSSLS